MTQAYERVSRKIYTNLLIFELFRSQSIRKSAYVNYCLFTNSTDIISRLDLESQSKVQMFTLYWCTTRMCTPT